MSNLWNQFLLIIGSLAVACGGFCSASAQAQGARPDLANDTPEKFQLRTESFDYIKREEMVPMRDGVKLKTFILLPKGANHAPMLLSPEQIAPVAAFLDAG